MYSDLYTILRTILVLMELALCLTCQDIYGHVIAYCSYCMELRQCVLIRLLLIIKQGFIMKIKVQDVLGQLRRVATTLSF